MKKIFLLLFFSALTNLFAKNLDSTFHAANELYAKKEYQKSIELFETLIAGGATSPEIFYNLGNAFFRTGKLGRAILFYEKARQLSPDDDDIRYNLKVASVRITDKIDALPTLFVIKWIDEGASFFSINSWAYIVYLFFILLLVAVYLFLFSNRSEHQKKYFYLSAIFLFLFIISSALVGRLNYLDSNFEYGIIVENTVAVKSSPDNSSSDVFVIHEGLKVEVLDKVEEWRKIKLPDGKVGWITKNEIGII